MTRRGVYQLIVWSVLASIAVLAWPRPSKFAEDNTLHDSPLTSKILKSTVTVLKTNSHNGVTIPQILGGGVIVRAEKGLPLVVLTAYHVALDLKNRDGFIKIYNQEVDLLLEAKVMALDQGTDLALLSTRNAWNGPDISATMADEAPRRGAWVYIAGAPAGREWNITKGIVSNKIKCGESGGTCYRTDAELFFGNSGGGAFDENGNLIGVADYVQVEYVDDVSGTRHMIILPASGGVISWNTVGLFMEKHNIH